VTFKVYVHRKANQRRPAREKLAAKLFLQLFPREEIPSNLIGNDQGSSSAVVGVSGSRSIN